MNRVNATEGEYLRVSQGGNIRNILYQEGQFDCARETIRGAYNSQNIYNMNPTDIEYNIADWALAGNKLLFLQTYSSIQQYLDGRYEKSHQAL